MAVLSTHIPRQKGASIITKIRKHNDTHQNYYPTIVIKRP